MFKRKQNKMAHVESLSHGDKMINGFAWLSAGLIMSRLLGAIYIIFWSNWIGEHYELANSLYAIAYNPYVLFIDVATAGIPLAITKQVSQLNAQNEYKASVQLFKYTSFVMLGLGIFASLVFYFSANLIASGSVQPTGDINDNIRVLRTLAPTLIILPFISILRGFFQGFQQMTTPAVSQIIEQFVRVGYMLTMTFYVMKIKNGSFVEAVEQSTLAAFVGALVALIFLGYEFFKSLPYIRGKMILGEKNIKIDFTKSVKTVLKDSIPFVLLSMGTSFVSIIDQFLYRPIVSDFSNYDAKHISVTYAWFSANAAKLTAIVGSFSAALTTASIPNIATLYQKGNQHELVTAIRKNIKLSLFIIVPASIGLLIVSPAIYRVFYSDANGAQVLRISALSIITAGIYSISVAIFQSMNYHKFVLQSVSILLLFKLSFDIILTAIFKELGPGLSTISATSVAILFLYITLKSILKTNLFTFADIVPFIQSTALMAISATIAFWLIQAILPEAGFFYNVIKVIFTAFVGGLVYSLFTLQNQLMDQIFPAQAAKLRALFKR